MNPLHFAIALGVSAIGGFQFIVLKVGVDQFPPILFAFARFAVVVALLWPFLKIVPGRMHEIAILAFFFGILHYPLMFIGIKLSAGVSSVAIAVQLYSPFSVLIAAIFLRERVGWRRLIGLVLAFGGVVAIGLEPSVFERLDALLYVIAGALGMGIAIVMISRTGGIPILTLQAWMSLMTLAPLIFLSALFEGNPIDAIVAATWLEWGTIAYAAVAANILGHGGWYYLQRMYPVSLVSTLLMMAPIFGVVMGVVILGEVLSWRFLFGAAVTLGGVVAIMLVRSRPSAA